MRKKYHINNKGAPAICRAKEGNCPYGGESGSENHFDTAEEAQVAADRKNESEFGLFNEIKVHVKKASTDKDYKEIENRMNYFKEEEIEENVKTYYSRSKSSEKLKTYTPNNKETKHYTEDRKAREDIIKDSFGEGNVIGHYKVHHEVKGKFKDQIFQVNDTGQIRIFDADNGRLVTTFIPSSKRMEIMLLRAGDIADEEWLEEIDENKKLFDMKWEKVKHKYKRKRKSNKFEKEVIINHKTSEDSRDSKSKDNKNKENRKHNRSKGNTSKNSGSRTSKRDIDNTSKNNTSKYSKGNAFKDRKRKHREFKREPTQYNKNGIPMNR